MLNVIFTRMENQAVGKNNKIKHQDFLISWLKLIPFIVIIYRLKRKRRRLTWLSVNLRLNLSSQSQAIEIVTLIIEDLAMSAVNGWFNFCV